jgi:hypothetical protein
MAKAQNLITEDDGDLDTKTKGAAEEQIVIVEEKPKAEDDDEKKTPSKAEDEKDDDDDHDERRELDAADDDDERAAIRERRRAEKLERKERREQAIKRDKLELDFLRKRNDELERRVSTVETTTFKAQLADVDRQIKAAADEVKMADQVIAKAVAAGNGDDVVKAMRYRDEALTRVNQLSAYKQSAQSQAQKPNDGIDERVVSHATDFMKQNKWYDPQGRDEDSAIVLAIDTALVRDGYDPTSAEYWDELRRRAARRLPDRFRNAKESAADEGESREERRPRGGPAVGSGREHAPASTRREVYISPERKQALIDAGVWDDPVLRLKYVRRYAEYDKQNRA